MEQFHILLKSFYNKYHQYFSAKTRVTLLKYARSHSVFTHATKSNTFRLANENDMNSWTRKEGERKLSQTCDQRTLASSDIYCCKATIVRNTIITRSKLHFTGNVASVTKHDRPAAARKQIGHPIFCICSESNWNKNMPVVSVLYLSEWSVANSTIFNMLGLIFDQFGVICECRQHRDQCYLRT